MTRFSRSRTGTPPKVSTYQSGVAQAAARRAFNRLVADFLIAEDLTPMQWFALGIIYDASPAGIPLSSLMLQLDTTLPYVTNTVALLEEKGYVKKAPHPRDSRIKLASIVPTEKTRIEQIEVELHDYLNRALHEKAQISKQEFATYQNVLQKIITSTG